MPDTLNQEVVPASLKRGQCKLRIRSIRAAFSDPDGSAIVKNGGPKKKARQEESPALPVIQQ